MTKSSASEQIDLIIKQHNGWKAEALKNLRDIIMSTDSGIFEEVKWKMPSRPEGLPVWSSNGIICFAEIWKDNIKIIFSKGAKIKDPQNIFNARLKSTAVRAVEIREGDVMDSSGIKNIIKEALNVNKN